MSTFTLEEAKGFSNANGGGNSYARNIWCISFPPAFLRAPPPPVVHRNPFRQWRRIISPLFPETRVTRRY